MPNMPNGAAETTVDAEAGGTVGAEDVATSVARLASLPGVSTGSAMAASAEHAQTMGRVLPVLPALAKLLPAGGLRRGSTISVQGSTSVLLSLLASSTAHGSWAAVVGVPDLGIVAANEFGVEVSRLALIPRPGTGFVSVVAALLDGMDLVAVCSSCVQGTSTARRLSERARHRGAVLLSFGRWPGADVELRCESTEWGGLDREYPGAGYLAERKLVVHAGGRRAAARSASGDLLLRGRSGGVTVSEGTTGKQPRGGPRALEELDVG